MMIDVKAQFGAMGDYDTDDTVALQNAINFAYNSPDGGTLYFPAGTYLISAPLKVPVTAELDKEVNWLGDGARATTIRPKAPIDHLLYITGYGGYVKGIEFKGILPYSADKAVRVSVIADDVKEKVFSNVSFTWAKKHGFHLLSEGNNNLMVFNESCKFDQNGTIISGSTATGAAGSSTVTFTGFNPVTAGVEVGSYLKVGTGKGSVYHVSGVTATGITVKPSLKSAIATGTAYKIHIGHGMFLDRGSDNNVFGIYDCHFVGNAGAGLMHRGLYGHHILGGNVDYNGITGFHLGSGMINITPSYSNTIHHVYFENNGYANVILDYPSGLDITEPLLAEPLDGTGGGIDSIVSLQGYYYDLFQTSVTYNGRVYEYQEVYKNSNTITLDDDSSKNVVLDKTTGTTATTINLPAAPTHQFTEKFEVFVENSTAPIIIKSATANVNGVVGTTGVTITAGKFFTIHIYYSKNKASWIVSHTTKM